MEPYISETTLRVRYQETDQMRVVYHTNYLVWFEVGRTDFIRHFGYTYSQLEEMGLYLPVVDLTCRYISPARYEDDVTIFTKILELRGSKLVFAYEAKRKNEDQLLAKGSTTHIWTNQQMKRVHLQREYPEIHQRLHKMVQN